MACFCCPRLFILSRSVHAVFVFLLPLTTMNADDWALLKKFALIPIVALVGMQLLRIAKLVFLDLFQTKGNYQD
jgi:hypothetical protein